jgi:hypothetical protein
MCDKGQYGLALHLLWGPKKLRNKMAYLTDLHTTLLHEGAMYSRLGNYDGIFWYVNRLYTWIYHLLSTGR